MSQENSLTRIAATSSTATDIVYAIFDFRTTVSENRVSDHHVCSAELRINKGCKNIKEMNRKWV